MTSPNATPLPPEPRRKPKRPRLPRNYSLVLLKRSRDIRDDFAECQRMAGWGR